MLDLDHDFNPALWVVDSAPKSRPKKITIEWPDMDVVQAIRSNCHWR